MNVIPQILWMDSAERSSWHEQVLPRGRARPTASAAKTPPSSLECWRHSGGCLFWWRPGKASTSLLFGQFAFVRQCLNAGKPDPRLLSEETSFQSVAPWALCWGPQAKGGGSSWPLQISRSGTHSSLRPSSDLYFSALVPEPTVLTGCLIETWQQAGQIKGSPECGSRIPGQWALSKAQTRACRPLPAADASTAASAQAAPPRAPEGATCELLKTAAKCCGDIGDWGKNGGSVGESGLLASSVLCLWVGDECPVTQGRWGWPWATTQSPRAGGESPFFFFRKKKNKVEDSYFLTSKLRRSCTNQYLTILSSKQEWEFLWMYLFLIKFVSEMFCMFLKLIGYFYKEVSVYRKIMQKVAVPM